MLKFFWTFMIGAFIGAGACAWWNAPKQIAETPTAEKRQGDGSLVLERKPDYRAKPAHAVPKGGKTERIFRVDVQPERQDCPTCTVDLTLVRMPDEMLRVVASSQTGTVMGGLDVPTVPLSIEKRHPWAAGISRGTGEESWGGWLDRDFDFLRVGIEANKTGEDHSGGKYEGRIRLGILF